MTDVEFRDGTHWVPDHLAVLMQGIETYRMTVEEATAEANRNLTRDFLGKIQDRVVLEHFRDQKMGAR